jgi:hypothetical protein
MGSPEMPGRGKVRGWTTTAGRELTRAIVEDGTGRVAVLGRSG